LVYPPLRLNLQLKNLLIAQSKFFLIVSIL
jgi:hypothetical protein